MSNRCLLCSSPAHSYTCTTKPQFSYTVCPSCGFTSLNGEHVLNPEQEKQRYLLHQNSKHDEKYIAWLEVFISALKQYLKPGSSILDFGSGPTPVLAESLIDNGFQVSLYDPYFAPNTAVFENRYHAIVIHEVIEHLGNPLAALQSLVPLLKPEGFLAIRTQLRPSDDEAFDRFWYRKDQTHRSFFMEKTWQTVAVSLNLIVTQIQHDIIMITHQKL